MSQTKIVHHEFTHSGTRKENQDNAVAYTVENPAVRNMDRGELFAVADGMGGHQAGREAALACCDRLFQEYYRADGPFDPGRGDVMTAALKDAFMNINRFMHEEGKENPDRSGWGCTVSALVIRGIQYAFAHVGDTRIYCIGDSGSQLLTEDQNVAYQMYLHKQTSYEEYLEGYGHNKLLSFMGQGKGMSVKTGFGRLVEGDLFLLCSDGLNQFVEMHEMEGLLRELRDGSDDREPGGLSLMDRLFAELTTRRIKTDLARDNVTFMLVGPGSVGGVKDQQFTSYTERETERSIPA